MDLLNCKMQGEVKAVLGFVNAIATTSEKNFTGNLYWWIVRADILGKDQDRNPTRGLENRLADRWN